MDKIMCIQWKSNKLGCSYFSTSSLQLYVMEDIKESNNFEYTTMLIAQILPKLIILSEASDNALFDFLQADTSIEIKKVLQKDFSFEKGRYMMLNWYINQLQQQSDYHGEDMANQKLYLMDPEEGNKTHAYLQLEELISLDDSPLTIGCAGVLLKHIQRIEQEASAVNDEENEESELVAAQQELSIQPISLRAFSCEKCMHVNSDTVRSLCIFDYERHPNMHQKREKESLSLFGLLNKTTSVLGKQLLSEWVSKPTRDKEVLNYRHESIRFLLENLRDTMQELSNNLKHVKNIHRLLAKVKESKSTANDWQHILKFAYYTIRIFGMLNQVQRQAHNIAFMRKVKNTMPVTEIMKTVGSDINDIINFELSKAEGRIIVKENVDTDLDLLREKYDALDNYLLQISQEISATLPVGLGAALNVVYFPQLGYLITLPQYQRSLADDTSTASSSHVSDHYARYLHRFELQFTTLEHLYYKNDKTKELDETVGDIHAMIADKEIEIMQDLSERVLQHATQFSETVNVLSELDCLLSLAMVALRFKYVEPEMTLDDSLVIVQGRHPLQELCVDIFIPNDTCLEGGRGFGTRKQNPSESDKLSRLFSSTDFGTSRPTSTRNMASSARADITSHATTDMAFRSNNGETDPTPMYIEQEQQVDDGYNSVQVVTGANFSGKSVYLKQIALIVYMAHIGSYVPADKAIIGITDKLYTRIQTSETVSKPQSAFAFDLQQLHRALNYATSHSLVIIDEFGKGTDSMDGAALFCSVIGYYLSKGVECPKIVASTHFHDVISQDILSMQDGITLSQTEIMSKQGEEGDEVVFLYRIVPGKGPSASYGIWCAGIAGLPSSTIKRAIELSDDYLHGNPIKKITSKEEDENYEKLKLIRTQFLASDKVDPLELIQAIEALFRKDGEGDTFMN